MNDSNHQDNDRSGSKPAVHSDWFNWGLHLMLGFLLGAGLACLLGLRMMRADMLGAAQFGGVILGGALLLAGIASHQGNKLRYRPSVSDPYEPPQGKKPKNYSLVIGGLGALFILVSVMNGIIEMSSDLSGESRLGAVKFTMLLPAAASIFWLRYVLKNGSWPSWFGSLDRDRSPIAFWFFFASLVFAIFGLLFVVVFG